VVVVEIVANRFAFLFLYFRQWVGGNAIRGGLSKTAWNMETGGWERVWNGADIVSLVRSTTLLDPIDT